MDTHRDLEGPTLDLDHAPHGGAPSAHRFSHAAMATIFEVYCAHEDERYAAQAAQAGFDLVDRLEQDLSRFIENSDISRIDHLSAGQATRVSPRTMECLQIAWRAHDLTGGAFDVSLGSAGRTRLELLPGEATVYAREAGAHLDLGGIGKGYAVDLMSQLLEEWELPCALVHGGFSSVLAMAPPPEREGWPLAFRAPGGDRRVLARVEARHRAFSASGVLKGDHILDPRTGLAARRRAAAWVAVPWQRGAFAAAVADALSTAFMLQPTEEIAVLCRSYPGLEAWIIPEPEEAGGPAPGLVHLDEQRP